MGFEEAGMAIHRIAKSYGMKDMRQAYNRAIREHPKLAAQYNSSATEGTERDYGSTGSEQAMAAAQVDREGNKLKAGAVLNHGALELCGSNQRGAPNQVSLERYRSAMSELMGAFPDLGACYSSGVIAPNNWALLATIWPSVASEIKKVHGVDPYNLRKNRYSDSRGARKYDDRGREYRSY